MNFLGKENILRRNNLLFPGGRFLDRQKFFAEDEGNHQQKNNWFPSGQCSWMIKVICNNQLFLDDASSAEEWSGQGCPIFPGGKFFSNTSAQKFSRADENFERSSANKFSWVTKPSPTANFFSSNKKYSAEKHQA